MELEKTTCADQKPAQTAESRKSRVQGGEVTACAHGPQHRLMPMIPGVIDEAAEMHAVAGGQMTQQMP
jgi:hypothetical protein